MPQTSKRARHEHRRLRLMELLQALEPAPHAWLATATGKSANYLSRLLSEYDAPGHKNMGDGMMVDIATALSLPPGWFDMPLGAALPHETRIEKDGSVVIGENRAIAAGDPPATVMRSRDVRPAPAHGRQLPVISYVQAGYWRETSDPYAAGAADEWIFTDRDLAECAFALRIVGDSMLPLYCPGDLIVIDPTIAPRPGDFVVAKNGSDEVTFKKYRPRGVNAQGVQTFELVPLNDDYPTIRTDESETMIIGVEVEHRRFRKSG